MHTTKHVFITGGVVSSLGKGLTSASVGLLLARRGYRVRMQKLDPYLNVDPGTMSPFQHGEVYVTADGAETDLDLGHYERIAGVTCGRDSNYTAGRIYSAVIRREREGGYLGKTVQVIPHVTDEIKAAIRTLDAKDVDVAITEIGGTVGDIESLPFLEAIRQYRQEIGRQNGVFLHLTLVPFIRAAGEMKTKPSQQSVGILRTIGIVPDILVCRCERRLEREHREKLALFCNVETELVIEEREVEHSIYEVPVALAEQGLDVYLLEMLKLHVRPLQLDDWKRMLAEQLAPSAGAVEIAVVGKYIRLQDAYKSVYEALHHGSGQPRAGEYPHGGIGGAGRTPAVRRAGWRACTASLRPAGSATAAETARRSICARNPACRFSEFAWGCSARPSVCPQCLRRNGANSAEFDPATTHPVIDLLPGSGDIRQGRHHASGRLSLPVNPGQPRGGRPTARNWSGSATATSSPTVTGADGKSGMLLR